MTTKLNRLAAIAAACGAITGLAGVASASANVNNNGVFVISGATLFFDFFTAGASTTDYIDVNKDGVTISNNPFSPASQLAQSVKGGINLTAGEWFFAYRSTGSGNGFAEMVNWGLAPDQTPDDSLDMPSPVGLSSSDAVLENGVFNRSFYKTQAGGLSALANVTLPGASPVAQCVDPDNDGVAGDADDLNDPTYLRASTTLNDQTGLFVDLAIIDVPVSWFVQIPGAGGPTATPGTPGYGTNVEKSNAAGTPGSTVIGGQSNTLKTLNGANGSVTLYNPANPPAPTDKNVVFDTPIAFAPVAVLTNLGTGLQTITYSQQQYSLVTGRFPDGRNFVQVTRDSGSGTRNGFTNTFCIDPSWGVGDNVGLKTTDPSTERLGALFTPSHRGGSGTMENTTQNHRLALGYTGAERGVGRWLTDGDLEILGVQNDIQDDSDGVTPEFVRPTTQTILHNGDVDTAYRIGGPETFGTIGDPRAEAVADGGDANGNPKMQNRFAAAYLNNITRSIEQFVEEGDPDQFSPGQYLGLNFFLTASTDYVQAPLQPCTWIPNPVSEATKAQLQDAIDTPTQVLNNPAYEGFGTITLNGRVPFRLALTSGSSYTDGVNAGANYINQSGANVLYGTPLNDRNRIAFDFDGDFDRDTEFDTANLNDSDIYQAVAAWNQRNGDGAAWIMPGNSAAVIEILGDNNGNGNFDSNDIRYWADGLAVDPATGAVNRQLGFELVDAAWDLFNGEGADNGDNFFGTQLATGAPYTAGASRADVAGSGTIAKGWAPVGADLVVDDQDLDYVYANFGDWHDLTQAATMDLSCDMNGDLIVDQADACLIVNDILGTTFGDVNLDGIADAADVSTVMANMGLQGGWAQGDVDGDGMVTSDDLDIVNGVADPCAVPPACAADIDGSGSTTSADLNVLLGNFGASVTPNTGGDLNADGMVTSVDLNILLGDFGCGTV